MTLEEMRISAQLHVGMPIEQGFARRYANEGLSILANTYDSICRKKKITLTITAGEETELPADCFQLIRLRKWGKPYKAFEVYSTAIFTEDSGEFEIEYLKMPTLLNAESDIPDIPRSFFATIPLFIGAREKFRVFGEEDVDSMRLLQEFYELAREANNRVAKHGKKRMLPVAEWR